MSTAGHHTEDERFTALQPVPGPPPPDDSPVRPLTRQGDLVMLSGQVAFRGSELVATGRVGDDITLELGQQCARQCTVNLLARLQEQLGSLAAIEQVMKLTVYVASAPGFREQHLVADAASQVLVDVLATGPHARAALGVAELPLGSPVEVEAVVALRAAG